LFIKTGLQFSFWFSLGGEYTTASLVSAQAARTETERNRTMSPLATLWGAKRKLRASGRTQFAVGQSFGRWCWELSIQPQQSSYKRLPRSSAMGDGISWRSCVRLGDIPLSHTGSQDKCPLPHNRSTSHGFSPIW